MWFIGCLRINSLQTNGTFKRLQGFKLSNLSMKEILNRGMSKIFRENGGLIVSQSAHHFVFPSGKHSDRFLRPGNVLLSGIHIQFICFSLYYHFKGKHFSNIYCDTSSINSLAYAFSALMREYTPELTDSLHIESFGSYKVFENAKFSAPLNCLFLISSSTSGSIIRRMMEDRKGTIRDENIAIIYGLDVEQEYSNRVLCDLSIDLVRNPDGLEKFESYNVNKGETCQFCKKGSMPVEIKGDVFLLEKPSVKGIVLAKSDYSALLKGFGAYFYKGISGESIIRCFYKENAADDKRYELYFDIETIFKEYIDNKDRSSFTEIFSRLEKHITSAVPASLKYIIVLPDNSSRLLAKIIQSVVNKCGIKLTDERILGLTSIGTINKDEKGTILVVSSSVATGRNLLFISRALRDFEENYQRIYFTIINRTSDNEHYGFLESNLSQGEFGKGTHRIINVKNILCPPEAYDTPWHMEIDFLKRFAEYLEEKSMYKDIIDYCYERVADLENSGKNKGLDNNLFFRSWKGESLKIRKGFAFAPNFNGFIESSSQSDIYFIICVIIHEIRNSGRLNQSEYVRNLLEPGNFVRYNDGIIQAAILRAAREDELRYDLSDTMSGQMQAVIQDMVNHFEDDHAEGLVEFFYAIALKKLRLNLNSLKSCISLIKMKESLLAESFLGALVEYIEDKVLGVAEVPAPILPEIPLYDD